MNIVLIFCSVNSPGISVDCDGSRWEYQSATFSAGEASEGCRRRRAELGPLHQMCIQQLMEDSRLAHAKDVALLVECLVPQSQGRECILIPNFEYSVLTSHPNPETPKSFICRGEIDSKLNDSFKLTKIILLLYENKFATHTSRQLFKTSFYTYCVLIEQCHFRALNNLWWTVSSVGAPTRKLIVAISICTNSNTDMTTRTPKVLFNGVTLILNYNYV